MSARNPKKLLIVIPEFNFGGTNKSLENILTFFSENKDYSLSIFCMNHVGPLKDRFADKGLLKQDDALALLFDARRMIKEARGIYKIKLLLKKALIKASAGNAAQRVYRNSAKKLSGYDTVIAFQEGRATEFVSYTDCPNKIAWVRCDYANYHKLCGRNELSIYNSFQSVVCVSQFTRDSFVSCYPTLADRTLCIYNFIDAQAIIAKSHGNIDDSGFVRGKQLTLVSVGRHDKVKQFELIPEIVAALIQKGIDVKAYLIGAENNETEKIREQISEYGVEDSFILLGAKLNPYPYMAKSDIILCTSLSEACPNIINEAKILGVPVVTTDFGSAKEFIGDGTYGIRTSQDRLADAIYELVTNKEHYKEIVRNAKQFVYPNEQTEKKIKEII